MSTLARLAAAGLAGTAAWLLAGQALAQETTTARGALGTGDSFVLSLEHLGGYSYSKTEHESAFGSGASESEIHQFGLFMPLATPFAARARVGFHYFLAPPLSLGAIASYSDNDRLGTFTLIGARVGAAFPVSGSTSVWLRGGIAYARVELESGGATATYSALVPGGEVLLALKPLDHFGFLLGGLFETAVGGKYEVETPLGSDDIDYKHMEVALSLGVFLEL